MHLCYFSHGYHSKMFNSRSLHRSIQQFCLPDIHCPSDQALHRTILLLLWVILLCGFWFELPSNWCIGLCLPLRYIYARLNDTSVGQYPWYLVTCNELFTKGAPELLPRLISCISTVTELSLCSCRPFKGVVVTCDELSLYGNPWNSMTILLQSNQSYELDQLCTPHSIALGLDWKHKDMT
jgi:hypothetical protein